VTIHNYDSGNTPDEGEQTWDTDALQRDFEVQCFLAPYVIVRRRSDGKVGSLEFRHEPREYFNWQDHR